MVSAWHLQCAMGPQDKGRWGKIGESSVPGTPPGAGPEQTTSLNFSS